MARRTNPPEKVFAVRDATPADAEAILRVRNTTWQVAYAHVFPREQLAAMSEDPRAANWASWWRGVIEDPASRAHTFVAEEAGEIVAFAHLGAEREDPSIGELYAIYVLPEAWGRSIGQALMDETLNRLRGEGFGEAVLWVLEDNPRTRRFYELAGWREDGGVKEEEWLSTLVSEVRYRVILGSPR